MSDTAGRAVVLAVVALALTAGGVAAFEASPQVDVETDSTSLNVDVRADGDATWEVVYRVRLDDPNTTDAFEDLSRDVDADPAAYTGPFEQRMQRTVAAAENATDREMEIRNVSVETRRQPQIDEGYGLLVYRLEWSGFAAVDGETVEAGDAIDQFFLDGETSLQFAGPDGYAVESVTPTAARSGDGEVQWRGQRDFDAGEPRVVFVPDGTAEATATPGSETGTSDGTEGLGSGTDTPVGGSDGTGESGLPVVLIGLAAVALAGGVWLLARRDGFGTDAGGATGGASDDSGTDSAAAATAAGTGDEGSADAGTGDATDGPPPDLLSNEERVLRLLEENGGRIKQKRMAEEFDWTAAKTSQVVGDLRDEDELESFRLGRENVLTLPDVDLEGDGDGE